MNHKPNDTLHAVRRNTALLAMLGLFLTLGAQAQTTNNVTGGDFISYTINTLPDPSFTLQRGVTYVFQLSNVSIHPFWIRTNLVGDFGSGAARYSDGVAFNGVPSGSVIFTEPASGTTTLFYQCGNHSP